MLVWWKVILKLIETCLVVFCRYADRYFPSPLKCFTNNFLSLACCSHKDSEFTVNPPGLPGPIPLPSTQRFSWEGVCLVCRGRGEEVLSMPGFHPSSLPPLPAHRGCIPVCSLPAGKLTRHQPPWLWQGWQCERDGFQTVLGGCTPEAQFPTGFSSHRAPCVSCLLLLIQFQSWEGKGGMWFSGSRHTQAPLRLTLFL